MTKFKIDILIICCLSLFSCSNPTDEPPPTPPGGGSEKISLAVSLVNEFTEPPNITTNLELELTLSNAPDGQYQLSFHVQEKNSTISLSSDPDKYYLSGELINVSFMGGQARIIYTAKNAGEHKITFSVSTVDETASVIFNQIFASEVYYKFNDFDSYEFLTGNFTNGSFEIANQNDRSNEFYAKYEILSGSDRYPSLVILNASSLDWSEGENKLLASGICAKNFLVTYSQQRPGVVEFKITLSDKYGWAAEKVYKFNVIPIIDINVEVIDTQYDSFSWSHNGINYTKAGCSQSRVGIHLSIGSEPYFAEYDVKLQIAMEYDATTVSKLGQTPSAPTTVTYGSSNWGILSVPKGQASVAYLLVSNGHNNNICLEPQNIKGYAIKLHSDMDAVKDKFRVGHYFYTHTYSVDLIGNTVTETKQFLQPMKQ